MQGGNPPPVQAEGRPGRDGGVALVEFDAVAARRLQRLQAAAGPRGREGGGMPHGCCVEPQSVFLARAC